MVPSTVGNGSEEEDKAKGSFFGQMVAVMRDNGGRTVLGEWENWPIAINKSMKANS